MSEVPAISKEEIEEIIKETTESNLSNQAYHHNKVGQWNSNIVEQALKKLTLLNKPYKFIVTCVIMQKNGAGLHSASSCYWDHSTDENISYKFDSKTMYAIVNVFSLAI
eukprot:Partr_v1_DN22876_c0_g1_i1_m77415 putative Dynein light chain